MDKIYKACADASRRKIMRLLRDKDLTAGEIALHFELTKPTLSRHFGVLREAGLIQDLKCGRNVTYHLNSEVLENALTSLMQDYDFVWTPPDDVETVAREIVESLVREEFAKVTCELDEEMASMLTPEMLGDAWRLTIEQFGAFVKELEVRTERYWKYTAVIITCQLAKSKLDVRVAFCRSGKISGLWFLKTD